MDGKRVRRTLRTENRVVEAGHRRKNLGRCTSNDKLQTGSIPVFTVQACSYIPYSRACRPLTAQRGGNMDADERLQTGIWILFR